MTLVAQLEALLFVADEPVSPERLADALEVETSEVEAGLEQLEADCREKRGIQLIKIAGGYQFCTRSEVSIAVGRFLRPNQSKLTRAAKEVLAIIAYQQPVTMAEIDAVRGVQSDHSVRALLDKRLVREVGRKPTPGRPLLYGTTDQFLHLFNLQSLEELPKVSLDEERELSPVESSDQTP